MTTVYIVTYSNHFIEEWAIKGVFEDAEKADLLAKDLDEEDKDVWSEYDVEEWSMADV